MNADTEIVTMTRRPLLLIVVLFSLTNPANARSGPEDDDPVPEKKPAPKPKEMVLKGTLTALEPEMAHKVILPKDQPYSISVSSPGFFTALAIVDERGRVVAQSKAGFLHTSKGGPMRLVVSSPGGSSGQYVIHLRPMNPDATKPGAVLTVGPEGVTVEAVLTKDDPLDKVRKNYCRIFDVKMQAGKKYVIDLQSKQFDSFLRLENAAGKQLAQDDDSGGGNDARIRFTAPEDGVFQVIVTSFGLETGLFLLKIRQE
jgi:hypothetical protein